MPKNLVIKENKKSSEYKLLKHEEHVLQLPDTYIGSVEKISEDHWIFDKENNKISKKLVSFIPGQYKLFDEVLVNALDHYVRIKGRNQKGGGLNEVKNIKVDINEETGFISVYNDGEGIPVEIHPEENIYVPELIFGNLLTSSNYNKEEIKHVGGKNGYGAKLANIFSEEFIVETVDCQNKKKYIQTFKNNMKEKGKPKITSCSNKPYTKISYKADFKRFNETGLGKDLMNKMQTRVYDVAANTDSKVNIFLNNEKLGVKTFESYIDLYLGDKKENPRVYEKINDRWEIGAGLNPNFNFEQISFVNGINTYKGGKHVDYITNQITKKLSEVIQKKKKIEVKPNFIKENLMIFVRATIDNPAFDSQIKENLTTPQSKFGTKCVVNDKFIEKLSKIGIIERAIALTNAKDSSNLKKTDGKKKSTLRGIPKLEDANWAGTKKAGECTLILTEGDSAKATAMAGLSVIGRDKFGVFPLKGKILNVKGEDNNITKKIYDNDEINNLKKIVGLQADKVYNDIKDLRYGKIIIFTDQDEDGSHIKGLIMNMFHSLWPSLFYRINFMNSILTPVIKATKNKNILPFYCVKDYEKWKKDNNTSGWKIKYYKGLGTSTSSEAKEYFRNLKLVSYKTDNDEDSHAIELAFNQKKGSSDYRKEWLSGYNKNLTLDYNSKNVPIRDFVHLELAHFSNSDNVRSIPNLIDGQKPSNRKIIYCCFKRNLKSEIRVAQLAGYVSEHGAYHHGEASLHGTIINMAQNYVGSNNINLLTPAGQFGTRIQGGKDAAQPRYIQTKLEDITFKLFNQNDNPLLAYTDDDGMIVEPNFYVPILPMILINGTQGIGTGWSTNIPSFNPMDIIKNIKRIMNGEDYVEMYPWYRGFKGTIEKVDNYNYVSKGVYSKIKPDVLKISELPIGVWTQKYKEVLESFLIDSTNKSKKQFLRDYLSYSSDTDVHFELHFPKGKLDKFMSNKDRFDKMLKLTSNISISNMVLFDSDNKIKKYDNIEEILREYVDYRIKFYGSRKNYLLNKMMKDVDILEWKVKFILDFINETIIINNKRKNEIVEQLRDNNYPTLKEIYKKYGEVDDDEYQYLLKMPIYNLTKDKIDELQAELEDKKRNHKNLEEKDENTLWNNDLSELNVYFETSKKKTLKIKN